MDWDSRLDALKVRIDGSGVDYTKPYWRIVAAWITVNGSWDTAPDWARKWQKDTLGGDHHAYGLALFKDGSVAAQAGFVLSWPGGSDGRTPEPDGWANLPLQAGFDPRQGPGPYRWQKYGNAEVLAGLGMPYILPWAGTHTLGGHHVSFFGVWQETKPSEPPAWKPYWLRVFGITLPVELKTR